MDGELLRLSTGVIVVMSTQRFLLGELSRKGKRNHQSSRARWDIAMHLGIHAEAPRLFHALTMPEYREVWMVPPDGRVYRVAARQHGGDYSVEFRASSSLTISVQGSWIVCRPDELAFTWSVEGRATCFMTTVTIRLQAGTGASMLHLYHSGFGTAADSLWHGKLWTASLEKLTGLVEQSRAGSEIGAFRIQGISRLHRNPPLASQTYSTLPA
jgi:uncharacterized protein YndB with AHSA1/START domain